MEYLTLSGSRFASNISDTLQHITTTKHAATTTTHSCNRLKAQTLKPLIHCVLWHLLTFQNVKNLLEGALTSQNELNNISVRQIGTNQITEKKTCTLNFPSILCEMPRNTSQLVGFEYSSGPWQSRLWGSMQVRTNTTSDCPRLWMKNSSH